MKADPNNSFAFNNEAVLLEREGKLNDALALLNRAAKHADEYFDKVTQTCFAGGGCLAVKPLREVGEKSSIAPIVQENITNSRPRLQPPVLRRLQVAPRPWCHRENQVTLGAFGPLPPRFSLQVALLDDEHRNRLA